MRILEGADIENRALPVAAAWFYVLKCFSLELAAEQLRDPFWVPSCIQKRIKNYKKAAKGDFGVSQEGR